MESTSHLNQGIDLATASNVKIQSKVGIRVEFGSYLLKTVENAQEMLDCLRLRSEVFSEEFTGKSNVGLDVDRFDGIFDHLVIYHQERKELVGTYRINCSTFSTDSYTALEFQLDDVWKKDGPFLELGRACIKKEYRKGAVIALLWRGIAEYMKQTQAKVLFGCSSVKVVDAESAAKIMVYLERTGSVDPYLNAHPTEVYELPFFASAVDRLRISFNDEDMAFAEAQMPSLLKSYLKNGAKVAMTPALDLDFQCIDVLTVLEVAAMRSSMANKYQLER